MIKMDHVSVKQVALSHQSSSEILFSTSTSVLILDTKFFKLTLQQKVQECFKSQTLFLKTELHRSIKY